MAVLRMACLAVVNSTDGVHLIILAVHHPGAAGGLLLWDGSTEATLCYQQASGSCGAHRKGTVTLWITIHRPESHADMIICCYSGVFWIYWVQEKTSYGAVYQFSEAATKRTHGPV